jgi:hypothetical protein
MNLFKTWGGDTGDKLVPDNDTIDQWFKKLLGCPYCVSFWISMAIFNPYLLLLCPSIPLLAYARPKRYEDPSFTIKCLVGGCMGLVAVLFPEPVFISLFIAVIVMTICERLGLAVIEQ